MYGRLPLQEILPEARKIDAGFVDIWPEVHGNQREQMEAMGYDAFERLLERHKVRLGCLTHYDLGPFRLGPELAIAKRFHCPVIVCGGSGPAGLAGAELKGAVKKFAELMKPHLELAEANGVSIAIENHGNNLIDSADSLKWLMDLRPSTNLKVALAPYHLEVLGVDEKGLAELITVLGNEIAVFYAWQHGMGCSKKLPKQQELLQMPGRGAFDFERTVQALKGIQYRGFTEIFMHPVPRGIPILPTAEETTTEINRSRSYLEGLLVAR
jgi:sugar phosphate isomerase/epimerase